MAKEKVVKLKVESNVNTITKEYKGLKKEVESTTESVDELNDSTKDLDKTTKTYSKKASKTFKSANTEVKNLGKNQKKANQGFRAGSQVIGFVGESLKFVGVESDALSVSMGAVDSAMRLGGGVEGLTKAKETIKGLGLQAKISAGFQYLLSTAVGTTSGALKVLRLALISTGIGAIVVGVGLLVANFDKLKGALMGGVDAFKEMGTGVKLLMYPLLPLIATIELVKKGLQALGIMETDEEKEKEARHKASMKRYEQEKIERARNFKARQSQFDRDIAMAEALGKSSYELRQEKLKDFILDQQIALQGKESALASMQMLGYLAGSYEELNKLKSKYLEIEDSIKDAQDKLTINTINNNKEIIEGEEDKQSKYKEYAENRLDAQRDLLDKQMNAEMIALETEKTMLEAKGLDLDVINQQIFDKELEQERINFQREYDDVLKNESLTRTEKNELRTALELEWTATEKQMRSDRHAEEIEEAREHSERLAEEEQARLDNLVTLEIDYYQRLEDVENEYYDSQKTDEALEIQAIKDKYFTIEQEAILNKDSIVNIVKLREEQIAEIEKKYREKKIVDNAKEVKDKRDVEMQKVSMGIDALKLIGGLADLYAGEDEERQKKAFNIKKAVDIASATLDGYKAVLSAYAQAPVGFKIPASIIAGGFSALQIANISKQKFKSPSPSDLSGGGGGGDEPTAPITPQFNIVGGAELNDTEGVGQQPLQAFVVSGDVTSAQSLDRNRVENATI